MENMGQYQQLVATYAIEIGTKIIAAIIFWIVGRWLIGLVGRMLQQAVSSSFCGRSRWEILSLREG